MTDSMPIVSAIAAPVTEIPVLIAPQLCTLVECPPSGADWLHEIKYDGWRLLARKHGDDLRLYTRGGIEWSERVPRLVDAIRSLNVASAWLDGEIVHLDDAGFPDFERLQHDIRTGDERGLVFQVFGTSAATAALGAASDNHPIYSELLGWVAEWFKAHAWKVCVRQKRTVGSNPTPSVASVLRPCLRGSLPAQRAEIQRRRRGCLPDRHHERKADPAMA